MKVQCFINSLSSGGAERQLVGLAIMLKQKGYEIEVCTYKTSNFYVEVLRSNGKYICLYLQIEPLKDYLGR